MRRKDEFQCLMSMPDLGSYIDKWIAIVGDEIVAVSDRGSEVFRKSKEKDPNKTPMILKIPSERVMLL